MRGAVRLVGGGAYALGMDMRREEALDLKVDIDASRLLIGKHDQEDIDRFKAAAKRIRQGYRAVEHDRLEDEDWEVEARLKGAARYVSDTDLSGLAEMAQIAFAHYMHMQDILRGGMEVAYLDGKTEEDIARESKIFDVREVQVVLHPDSLPDIHY